MTGSKPNTAPPGAGQSAASPADRDLLDRAAAKARAANVFASVTVTPAAAVCTALNCPAPAEYRLSFEDGALWVCFVTPDRWLSQSIEADLVHTGDDLAELIEEELVDLGYSGPRPTFEHFRSQDKLFTFRTPLPRADASADPARFLLAYEACFRRLGDVGAAGDDDGE